ncbi:MAG: hypothetical protein ACLSF6_03340 [Evtepia gabavorous]
MLALDVDCMVLWTLHQHLGFGVKRLHDFYLRWPQSTAGCVNL